MSKEVILLAVFSFVISATVFSFMINTIILEERLHTTKNKIEIDGKNDSSHHVFGLHLNKTSIDFIVSFILLISFLKMIFSILLIIGVKKVAMGLPKLETCCFIFDLKTGNIVMGCLNALLSFTLFVIMIVISATIQPLKKGLGEMHEFEAEAKLAGIYAMSVILVIMFLAKFCFDVFFIFGVATERPAIIRAYFFMWVIFFLLSMFTFFLNAPNYETGTICVEVFYIAINVYAILLSHSFYVQLNTREEV